MAGGCGERGASESGVLAPPSCGVGNDAASLAFPFGAARCDRIVAAVLSRIGNAR
jgi:hypothetical protein